MLLDATLNKHRKAWSNHTTSKKKGRWHLAQRSYHFLRLFQAPKDHIMYGPWDHLFWAWDPKDHHAHVV